MPAHWFVAGPQRWTESAIELDADESRHAAAVLRLQIGDEIVVADGRGAAARCSVARIDPGRVVAAIESVERRASRSPELCVFQGAAKHAKVDDVVERLAEIGAAEISIFESARSVVRWDEPKRARLAQRWAAIARAAAKQSRNPFVAATGPPLSWDELAARAVAEDAVLVLWEEATEPLRAALGPAPPRIALVVGPEGGMTPAEAAELAAAGGRLVSLGPTVLRTENAALVAAAAVLYHYGAIG